MAARSNELSKNVNCLVYAGNKSDLDKNDISEDVQYIYQDPAKDATLVFLAKNKIENF